VPPSPQEPELPADTDSHPRRIDELKRAVAFIEDIENRAAEKMERVPEAVAITHPRFPAVYSLNFVRVDPSNPPRDARAIAELADRLQAPHGLTHRRVLINDEDLGDRMAPGFRELGWLVDRLVVMALHSETRPVDNDADVREFSEREVSEARRRYYGWRSYSGGVGLTNEVVDQLVNARVVTAERVGVRNYAAIAEGEIVSFSDLYSDGSTAQIEDVGTIEPYRKRGLSRAVVQRAVDVARAEGHDLIFLVADEEDWPKDFYARLGFDPIGAIYEFTLLPDRAAGA
jgi:GNAT superfamily N-acetyltransferase